MSKPRSKTWHKRAKQVGRDAESAVCDYLRSRGIPAERRRLTGTEDCGDIATGGLTIEVKACKRIDLAGWLTEAEVEGNNADKAYHGGVRKPRFVVAKRRGTLDTAKWFAVMTLEQAIDLHKAAATAAHGGD